MKVTIDRFEDDFAVVELPDKTFVNAPKQLFFGAKEGDIFDISIDQSTTEKRKRSIKGLMDELFRD